MLKKKNFFKVLKKKNFPCTSRDISFLPTSFKSPHSLRLMRARDTAYFESYATVVFRPVLSKRASKAKIVWHLSMLLKFGDEYFCFGIYFSKIFFSTFFSQNFCSKFFFQNFFFKIFFPKFLLQIFFQIFFFCGLYSRCLPVYREKTDSTYLCYEKYDKQAVEIGL